MQIPQTSLKKHLVYKGYTVIDVTQISDYNATGIWLRHNQTGLEVFHLLTDDEENLFSFAFKTLPEDSKGSAHILEHSVLCGSSRFPLKDPFIRLANQSVKTFLNAMTSTDMTLYPASSMVESDYFNLMAVYGDAVFFPLLDSKIFSQEAHRLECDKDNNLTIQGVVYNEMKGNYSSLENVVDNYILQTLLPGTPYAFDSGGDPAHIPELTHHEFRDFHAKFYHPSNCRVFLYGNIPTEKQLDFISERFLAPFTNFSVASSQNFHLQDVSDKAIADSQPQYPPPVVFTEPKKVRMAGPSGESNGSTVVLSWLMGDSSDPVQYMEMIFLSEILLGHDGSPLMRALLECGLGEDVAPSTGISSKMRYLLLSVGLRGVKKENEDKIEGVIMDVLKNLCEQGISADDVKSAMLSVEFDDREVKRVHGPYSLVLMRRSLRGWAYGRSPSYCLSNRTAFAEVKRRLETDSNYIINLLRRLLVDNNHRVNLTVYPDDQYNKNVKEREQEMVKLLSQRLSDSVKTGGKPVFNSQDTAIVHEKNTKLDNATTPDSNTIPDNLVLSLVKNLQSDLNEFQQSEDDPEIIARMPHIKPSDLTITPDQIPVDISKIEGVPVFESHEATNGIVYMEACFPVDVLESSLFEYLPFFSTLVTNTGFAGLDWAKSAARSALVSGDFGASLFTSSVATPQDQSEFEVDSSLVGRSWIFFHVSMLNELIEPAIQLLFDCFSSADFSDLKRIKDLVTEYRNDFDASIVPAGNYYSLSRTSCRATKSKALDEIWNGLSQLYTAHRLVESDSKLLSQKCSEILTKLVNAGTIFHITADADGMEQTKKCLQDKIKEFKIHAPVLPLQTSDDEFFALTEIPSTSDTTSKSDKGIETYTVQTQIGFAACSLPSSSFGTDDLVYEKVFSHWLTNTLLWEQIRTIGGAYGAYAYPDGLEKSFHFATFRDPKPFESLKVFSKCLEKAASVPLDDETLEKAITGTYSKEIQPRSPSSRGFTGFIRKLYGLTDKTREKSIKTLLSVTAENIQSAAIRLSKLSNNGTKAVLCGKNEKLKENTGIIVNLPL